MKRVPLSPKPPSPPPPERRGVDMQYPPPQGHGQVPRLSAADERWDMIGTGLLGGLITVLGFWLCVIAVALAVNVMQWGWRLLAGGPSEAAGVVVASGIAFCLGAVRSFLCQRRCAAADRRYEQAREDGLRGGA